MIIKYIVEGRIIPERVLFECPQIDFGNIKVQITKSKIFIIIECEEGTSIPDLRNQLFSIIGNIVNFAGFKLTTAMSYELESIVNMNTNEVIVFGTEGHVFENPQDIEDQVKFTADQLGAPLEMSTQLAMDPIVSRAAFELRNTIRYPDFTAMHCKLAIEAVRNGFCDDFEKTGWEGSAWQKMRDALNLSEDSFTSFNNIANEQRHGRNRPQTWEQRRVCMQIAWETLHRFLEYLSNGKTKLTDADYPKLTMVYPPEPNDSTGTPKP